MPICHPIRWPGSWHRKGEPRLCEIIENRTDVEIDLGDALSKLKQATPEQETQSAWTGSGNGNGDAAKAPQGYVSQIVSLIPNPDLDWSDERDEEPLTPDTSETAKTVTISSPEAVTCTVAETVNTVMIAAPRVIEQQTAISARVIVSPSVQGSVGGLDEINVMSTVTFAFAAGTTTS